MGIFNFPYEIFPIILVGYLFTVEFFSGFVWAAYNLPQVILYMMLLQNKR